MYPSSAVALPPDSMPCNGDMLIESGDFNG
jgi:hypothetical protein